MAHYVYPGCSSASARVSQHVLADRDAARSSRRVDLHSLQQVYAFLIVHLSNPRMAIRVFRHETTPLLHIFKAMGVELEILLHSAHISDRDLYILKWAALLADGPKPERIIAAFIRVQEVVKRRLDCVWHVSALVITVLSCIGSGRVLWKVLSS